MRTDLGNPAAHDHLESSGAGDQVENLGLRHLELAREGMKPYRPGYGDDQARGLTIAEVPGRARRSASSILWP